MFHEQQIIAAYKKAIKTRKNKIQGIMFERELERNLKSILSDLNNRVYIHGRYKKIILNDGKKRYIYTPDLRDHIVHHVLYETIYNILDPKIAYNSFASRKGKGIHKGLKFIEGKLHKLKNSPSPLWYMKIDMSKYFYSIPHKELKEKLFKFIWDEDIRYLIHLIIDSYIAPSTYDHLFPKNGNYNSTQKKGLPIGAISSQVFANFYLYDIDHYINHSLKPKIYLRYMDDLIFVDYHENLKNIKQNTLEILNKNKLFIVYNRIKVNKIEEGLNLLGFRLHLKNNKIVTQVSRRNKKKFWKLQDELMMLHFSAFSHSDIQRVQSVLESRKSHFKHTLKSESYLKEYSMSANTLIQYLQIASGVKEKLKKLL